MADAYPMPFLDELWNDMATSFSTAARKHDSFASGSHYEYCSNLSMEDVLDDSYDRESRILGRAAQKSRCTFQHVVNLDVVINVLSISNHS